MLMSDDALVNDVVRPLLVLLLVMLTSVVPLSAQTEEAERISESTRVLAEIMDAPDAAIPGSVLENAEAIAVNATAKQSIIDAGGEIRMLDDAQRAAWVDAMKPVWEKFADDVGQDMIDAAQEINASM